MKSQRNKFRAVKDYYIYRPNACELYDRRLTYNSRAYDRDIFLSVIHNEYALRELVQRMESLRQKIKALEKIADSDNDTQLAQLNTELTQTQKAHALQLHQHYLSEVKLSGGSFKEEYDSLRLDPSWYIRHELVQDCKDRGGCCSRACGCCAQRHLKSSGTKGIGHCTWDCYCCASHRGFEFSAQEKQNARKQLYNSLKSWDPGYLLKMTNAFFTQPEPKSKSKTSEWKLRRQSRHFCGRIKFWKC